MQNTENNAEQKLAECNALYEAINPVISCGITFSNQRMLINQMFASAAADVEEHETEGYTAKKFKDFYLALIQVFENLEKIEQIDMDNQIMLLDNIKRF